MGITANSGPYIGYGITTTSSGGTTEYNEERGPSLYDLGTGILDPRPPYNWSPGAPVGRPVYGLFDNVGLVDAVPSVQNSSNSYTPGTIVSCLTGSSILTTLTLNTTVTSSVNGITLNPTIVAPETGFNVTPAMAIDYTTPALTFGSGGTVNIWNPNNAIARCIAITGSSSGTNDSSVTLSVYGRDIYGFKMTETITLGASGYAGAFGQKAFKYIHAMALNGSSQIVSSHINIGFADKFGFPARVDTPLYQDVLYASSGSSVVTQSFSSAAVITYALSTGTAATATTADVRGVWSSTGTNWVAYQRLQMYTNLNPVNLATITSSSSTPYAGIFGMPQYSSN